MELLGIDLGDKKVGTAVCVQWVSIPKDIVPRIKIIPYIKNILQEYSITHIVVGLPYDLYGIDMKQLDKTKKFIEKLRDIFPEYEVVGYDERFTSFEARRWAQKEKHIDDISASLILEWYVKHNSL